MVLSERGGGRVRGHIVAGGGTKKKIVEEERGNQIRGSERERERGIRREIK